MPPGKKKLCQILEKRKETRQPKLDPVPCCTHPTDLFRLIGNPIVFSMNVDLELFLFTYSLPHPSPSIQHRRDPPNTTHVVGFIYSCRTGKGNGEKKGKKEKNREELSVVLVRTVLSSSSAALRACACHAICGCMRRCYLVKSSCHL